MSAPIPFVRMAYSARPLRRIGRGGSVSRRDRNQVAGNCAQLAWAHNSKGKVKPIPSYSSGGGLGEALLLEKRLPQRSSISPHRIGRGGSVSRRDRNQVAGNCAHLAWARNSEGKVKSIPSYSSGEGVWGRGASLREAASPPESLIPIATLREGARGRGLLLEKPPPSHTLSFLFIRLLRIGFLLSCAARGGTGYRRRGGRER